MTDMEILAEYQKHFNALMTQTAETEEETRSYANAQLVASLGVNNVHNLDSIEGAKKVIAELDAKREKRAAVVRQAFEAVNGPLTKDAALAECRTLLKAAHALVEGKDVEIPPAVVNFQYFDSAHVQENDVTEAQKIASEAADLVEKQMLAIQTNQERIAEAQKRTEDDPSLLKKIQDIESHRAHALLAGRDVSSFTNEIVQLKGQVDAARMASKLALKDVEFLQSNEAALEDRLEKIKAIVSIIEHKAIALKAHSLVKPCNELARSYIAMFKELRACCEKERPVSILDKMPINTTPHCWPLCLELPIWLSCTDRPDDQGIFYVEDVKTTMTTEE